MPSDAPKVLRCAIYTRKSSEEGLEQSFNSLDAQREACAAFILSQRHEGWVEVSTRYDDGGFSGGSMNRPALAALMRDIDAGLVDSVVVYKVDRLTRALSDFAKIVDCFDAKKVSFVSVTQQFNTTTSMGRLTLNVLLSFAQFEREVTGERIRDKIAASKKKGMWMGGRVPMGYDLKNRKLVINEAEANAVCHFYQRYLTLGCVSALKAELDAQGVVSKVRTSRTGKTSGGLPYSRGALYELLQNRLYIGQTNHKQQAFPGEHIGIVDTDLWSAVQAKLRSNTQGRRSGARSREPSLLVGRVFTEEGDRLIPSHTVKGGKRYRYYVSAPGSRKMIRIPATDLENVVVDRLKAFLASPKSLLDELGCKSDAREQEALVAAATRWAHLGRAGSAPINARDFVRVVTRVVVGIETCSISCSANEFRDMVLGTDRVTFDEDHLVQLVAAVRLQRRGLQVRLVMRDDHETQRVAKRNTVLIKAAARGRHWYEQLISGQSVSLKDLASGSAVNDRYASRILRCAFLAPDLVESLLEGQVAAEQTLLQLLAKLPRNWAEQRQMLA